MSTVEEAAGTARTPMGAALAEGIGTISYNQVVEFNLYVRLVLPLDGYVFWVRADLVSQQSLLHAMQLNPQYLSSTGALPPVCLKAQGSLHYATDTNQAEDASVAVNRVVFSSLQEIDDLNIVNPGLIYIGDFDGIQFAFSSRGSFYQQANLWHYVGNAVYSTMETQVINDPREMPPFNSLIVSNSLPSWLALYGYAPAWHVDLTMPVVPFFPSFLVPDNLPPPYVAVHIEPSETRGLASAPQLSRNLSHGQLARDLVRLTLYGINNDTAQSILDCILQYSIDTERFGIMGLIPIVRELKLTQNELSVIAQKKEITFEVSYVQLSMRNIARQLVETAMVSYLPQTGPPIPFQNVPIVPIS